MLLNWQYPSESVKITVESFPLNLTFSRGRRNFTSPINVFWDSFLARHGADRRRPVADSLAPVQHGGCNAAGHGIRELAQARRTLSCPALA